MNRKLTVAECCLKYGTGSYNIDACRVGSTDSFGGGTKATTIFDGDAGYEHDGWKPGSSLGRFPANILFSHSSDCEYLGVAQDTRSGGERTTTCHSGKETISGGEGTGGTMEASSQVPTYNCSPDCPCKLLDEQAPRVGALAVVPEKERTNKKTNCYGEYQNRGNKDQKLDGLGGASRFFMQFTPEEEDG